MCFDGHVLPSKAQFISSSPHLKGTPSKDQVITMCLYFVNPDLGWPSNMCIWMSPISLNVSHKVQHLQFVIIGSYIQYMDGFHFLYHHHHGHFEGLQVSFKTPQDCHSLRLKDLPVNPVRTTSTGCQRGSRSQPFFTSWRVWCWNCPSNSRLVRNECTQPVLFALSLKSNRKNKDIYYGSMSYWTSRVTLNCFNNVNL